MRPIPRSCPSMRFRRFASATLSAPSRATADLRDAIPCVLHGRLERVHVGACRVIHDTCRSRLQGHVYVRHTGYRLQHPRDASDAPLATHALHVEFRVVHSSFLSIHDAGLNRRNRSALLTTETELIAIAAPAITGLSNPTAASGMPSTL